MEQMLRKIEAILRTQKLKYVIIGGIASSIWGKPRTTLDTDVVLILPPSKIAKLLKVLVEEGFNVRSIETVRKKLVQLKPAKITYSFGLSLEFRRASYSIDFNAIKRAVKVKLFDLPLYIATPEDIIVYKGACFDDLDKADMKSILSRLGDELDYKYIDEAAKKLADETGDEQIYENIVSLIL